MDPPSSQERNAKDGPAVAPLAQRTRDGRPYLRPPDIEAEIAKMLAIDPAAWSLAELKSETLVHLARWLWRRRDLDAIGKVIGCLAKRITRIARDFSSGLGKSGAEDFVTEIATDINILIFAQAPNRQSEFLECAFRLAVKRRALNKRELLDDRAKLEKCESSMVTAGDAQETRIVESYEDYESGPLTKTIEADFIRKGLAAISKPLHREAVILHFLQGWPLKSEDPAIPNLSTHFNKTPRRITDWLKRAISEMRAALGDEI